MDGWGWAEGGEGLGKATGILDGDQTSIDFGRIPVGEETLRMMTLENSGSLVVAIDRVDVSDADAFTIAQTPRKLLPPGEKTPVQLLFKALREGEVTGTLSIRHDGRDGMLEVGLKGTGFIEVGPGPRCRLAVEPSSIDLEYVYEARKERPLL